MESRRSHLSRLATATRSSWVGLFLGITAFAFLQAAYEPPPGRAKGVQPGYFTVKPHEPLPLREIDNSPAEFERLIDAKTYLSTPPDTLAGAHPDLTLSVVFLVESIETVLNEEDVTARYVIQLPPGLVANFGAIPACTLSAFESTVYDNETAHCSAASQLGVVSVLYGGELPDRSYPLYKLNIQNLYGTHGGHLGAIGFPYELITTRLPIILRVDLRTDGDYGMTLTGRGRFPEFTPAPFFTFWGNPWDPTHDFERWDPEAQEWGASVNEPSVPFITHSSNCNSGVLESRVKVQYWFEGDHWFPDDPEDFAYRSFLPASDGCEAIEFSPRGEVSPTSNESDSSTGLSIKFEIPRSSTDNQEASPVKDFTMKLPAGMSANPATLNGMTGCAPSQIGLMSAIGPSTGGVHFALGEAHCPDASKIGVGTVSTPLIDEPVKVALYFATPYKNPFQSLMAFYGVFESLGFTIKLAGKIYADPNTGQLTARMESVPELPIERADLRIFEGPRAPLSSPSACSKDDAVATFVPWSALDSGATKVVRSRMKFEVTGNGHRPCSGGPGFQPFAPVLTAGLRDVAAGGYSPLIVRVERPQGDQGLRAVSMTLPRGLAASMHGASYCSDGSISLAKERDGPGGGAIEQENPSCPSGAKVGSAAVGIGTGSVPLFSRGTVYLAGPYKAAPFSLVVITPAIAGGSEEDPLVDLGTVVVRVALSVDQRTGRITAISDPLPQMIEGIPLRVHDIRLLLDRPDFVRSPTSCDEMKVDAEIESSGGAVDSQAKRFQVEGCRRLRFLPRFSIEVKREAARQRKPRLQAVVTAGPSQANISRARITLPASVGASTPPIRDACPRPLLLKRNCPRRSIHGHAVALSPLLSEPLSGPILMTSVDGQPDLVLALTGQMSFSASGEVRSKEGRLRVTFSGLPDVPLSRLTLSLHGGSLGISTKEYDQCGSIPPVVARFTAHNGNVRTRRAITEGSCSSRNGRVHVKQSKRK